MPSYSPSPAMRSGIQAQLDFLTELTRRTYDSVRKLSELNLHFAQQVLQDTGEAARKMASCTDPFQFAAAAASAAQPAMQHAQTYQQQLVGVLSGAQLDLARKAEAMLPEGARHAADAALQSFTRASDAAGAAFSSASPADGSSPDGAGAAARHSAG